MFYCGKSIDYQTGTVSKTVIDSATTLSACETTCDGTAKCCGATFSAGKCVFFEAMYNCPSSPELWTFTDDAATDSFIFVNSPPPDLAPSSALPSASAGPSATCETSRPVGNNYGYNHITCDSWISPIAGTGLKSQDELMENLDVCLDKCNNWRACCAGSYDVATSTCTTWNTATDSSQCPASSTGYKSTPRDGSSAFIFQPSSDASKCTSGNYGSILQPGQGYFDTRCSQAVKLPGTWSNAGLLHTSSLDACMIECDNDQYCCAAYFTRSTWTCQMSAPWPLSSNPCPALSSYTWSKNYDRDSFVFQHGSQSSLISLAPPPWRCKNQLLSRGSLFDQVICKSKITAAAGLTASKYDANTFEKCRKACDGLATCCAGRFDAATKW
jgi:hypothetical protein